MILIIGTPDDAPTVHVQQALLKRKAEVLLFDTTQFPWETRLSFDWNSPVQGTFQPDGQGPKVPLSAIRSVYRRWSRGIRAPVDPDPALSEILYWNVESAVGSFLRCLDCLWVNSTEATELHKYKGYQLKLLAAGGLRVPRTLITNDPEEVTAFYEAFQGEAIYKPVRGWANTERLTPDKLTPESLAALSKSPVKLQEFVPGRDIRVYLVDGDIFALEIESSTLDFRADPEARRVPVRLPEAVETDCRKLAEVLGLVFTGIDLRRTPQGEYVFFEGNPTPVFLYDETASGYPITDHLVDFLIRGERSTP